MIKEFSVLMSIYHKEKPQNFCECMESILKQSVQPAEIVLVEDGKLTDELYEVIDKYKTRLGDTLTIVINKENIGLGLSLAKGVKACKYDLIARMDTDDICAEDRFEKQLLFFDKNPKLDVVGGHIQEFYSDVNVVSGCRKVPLTQKEIYKYQRKRDALNHVTVMFKKSTVLAAGNYKHCLLMEDSLLWANMIRINAKMANIDDVLVYVRTGEDMLKRRGGLDYFKKYESGRRTILKTGTISASDYLITVIAQFVVCIIPLKLREFVFNKILRK